MTSDLECTDDRITSSLSGTDCMIVDNGTCTLALPKFKTMKKMSADGSLSCCRLYTNTLGPNVVYGMGGNGQR